MPEIQLQPRASNQRPMCVCCRGELGSNDAALACTECNVPLHWECWRSLKRCPTSGCPGKAKHSDRLTAELSEWGPIAPQIRGDLDAPGGGPEPAPHAAPPPARSAPLPPAPGKDPAPDATRESPVEATRDPRTQQAAWRPDPESAAGVTHDAPFLTRHGADYGLIAGGVVGMIVAVVSGRHFGYGRAILGAAGGALAGLPAGFVMGYLQSVVGLRYPQPEGLGLVSVFASAFAALVGFLAGGPVGATLLAVPVWLVCGRLFGFHPGETRS